jgi:hypothetical protein
MTKKLFIGATFVFAALTILYWNHMTSVAGSPTAAFREYEAKSKDSNTPVVHTLEAEVLKMYMASMSHAAIDVRFVNTSPNELKHWSITLEAYDKDGRYLAKSEAMASYMRPGESKVEEITLLRTNYADIADISLSLSAVVGASGLREDRQYNLEWRINPGKEITKSGVK